CGSAVAALSRTTILPRRISSRLLLTDGKDAVEDVAADQSESKWFLSKSSQTDLNDFPGVKSRWISANKAFEYELGFFALSSASALGRKFRGVS
ncbi:hypothetical protein BGW38_010130, partial [Lunasporangiospora selenospora]